ncbi:diacylglycerol kinase [Altererythrobacter sp. CC-YST694]|uniref:diacylglycerol kinase family protein n=1 Tax=Altererythrobacter sp. CC-YST694 TaxID=2755038 RepID=UPI001D0103B9|nr:diacylglycerol kinase family protein [Altererythrobacter sp. CC-YST694]MCB5425401.1 diacylglycerol kinase [Altererythrobacter sp. CC-YST694]
MKKSAPIWLVTNAASGSNNPEALAGLEKAAQEAGINIERTIHFPADELPSAAELDAAGLEVVAVFAGDGTVNALIRSLYGWGGAVLVLPGGTKNLLFHRLHGQREPREIFAALALEEARRVRPGIIRCPQGDGLAGLMAGPGTAWYDVREAMRQADLAAMASGTAQAIGATLAAPMIACSDPALGRKEGYPLIMLTPQSGGFVVDAYHAETVQDYLAQGLALLRREFRDGPSDRLGLVPEIELASVSGEPLGLLIDGEKVDCAARVRFRLVPCEVDLLSTETS